jgi:hypothetical protein
MSAALSRLRRPTAGACIAAAVTGLCTFFTGLAFTGTGQFRQEFLVLGGFMAAVFWSGWGACKLHKNAPLHAKVDAIGDGVSEMLAEIRSGSDPAAGGGRPELTLHKGGAA